MVPAMTLALDANFGSVQGWRDAFAALAVAAGNRPAELRLSFVPSTGALINERVAQAQEASAERVPMLSMQLPHDLPTFIAGIDWDPVYERYQHAVHAASEGFGASHDDVTSALLLDVRRAGVFEQAGTTIPGARWCDPAAVATWAATLPINRPVLVYCVYGHEVSRATAMRLRAAGVDARYLAGGIDGWTAAGRPLVEKRSG